MTPKEFTKTKTVNVIYDRNGQHILEKHVYELMQEYAEEQLILHGVDRMLNDKNETNFDVWLKENNYKIINGTYINKHGYERTRNQLWQKYIED